MRSHHPLIVLLAFTLLLNLCPPSVAKPVSQVSIVYSGMSGGFRSWGGTLDATPFFDPRFKREVEVKGETYTSCLLTSDAVLFDPTGKARHQDLYAFLKAGGIVFESKHPTPVMRSIYGIWAQVTGLEHSWAIPWLYERLQEAPTPDRQRTTGQLLTLGNRSGARMHVLHLGATPPSLRALSNPDGWESGLAGMLDAKRGGHSARVIGALRGFGEGARRVALIRKLSQETSPALKVDLGDLVTNLYAPRAADGIALDLEAISALRFDALVPFENELSLPADLLSKLDTQVPLLAANLKATRPDGFSFKPSLVKEVGGRRIGLVGLVDDKALLEAGVIGPGTPWEGSDAITAARLAIDTLKEQGADPVVLLTNIKDERLLKLQSDVRGAPLLIAPLRKTGTFTQRETIELEGIEEIGAPRIAHTAGVAVTQAGRATLTFDGAHGPLRSITTITQTIRDLLPSDPAMATRLRRYWKQAEPEGEALLPDMREVAAGVSALTNAQGDPRDQYGSTEWARLVAASLRRASGSEVAISRHYAQASTIIGEITEFFLNGWLAVPDKVVSVTLKGSDLQTLASRSRELGDFLVFAGFEPSKGIVGGRRLNPDESYRVTTTDMVVRNSLFSGAFRGKSTRQAFTLDSGRLTEAPLGEAIELRRFIKESLRALKERHQGFTGPYLDELRARLTDDGSKVEPRVEARIDELNFNFNDFRVSNAAAFSEVRNTRINTPSNVAWGGQGRLAVLYDTADIAWENRAQLGYNKMVLQTLGQEISQENTDDVVLTSEFRLKFIKLQTANSAVSLVPYLSGSYDTEFTPTEDRQSATVNPVQRELNGSTGIVLYPGGALREVRLGAIAKSDFAVERGGFEPGVHLAALYEQELNGIRPMTFRLEGDVKHYFLTPEDTADDLGLLASLTAAIRVPLWENLSLSIGAESLWFSGKVEANRGLGSVLNPNIGLVYATTWKPQFGLLF